VENANLKKLRKGKANVPHFEPIRSDKHRVFYPAIITADGREYIRLHGSPLTYSNVWEHLVENAMLLFPKDNTPWVEVISEENISDVHYLATADQSIVDLNGRPIPVARTFEFTNGSYDLEKACKVLAKNPEMEIIPDRSGNLIHHIPSYNVTEGETMEMKVRWTPGHKSWAKLIKEMATLHNPNGSPVLRQTEYELLTQYDVLGLSKAGLRHVPKYE
jgi:hypothetical protein